MSVKTQDDAAVDAENPWPGLSSFREVDAEFFHGRKIEIEELGRMVLRERVTLLFGASGLGKTSLLQAGLFPAVRNERLLPVMVRLRFNDQDALAPQVQRALTRAAEAALLEVAIPREGESLWETLCDRTRIIKNRMGQPVIPLLVFDQFEELFTLGANHPDRAAFMAELACLVEGYAPASVTNSVEEHPERADELDFHGTPYRLVFGMREDFMAELDCLRRLMPSVMQNRYRLCAFDTHHAREVIALPGAHLVDEDAVAKIVEFVARRPRPTRRAVEGSVDPTILSIVCRELNNQRRERNMPLITADLLKDIGEQILASLYERALQCVPAAGRETARCFIEDRLVNASGFRSDELQSYAEATIGKESLKALVDSRVLRLIDREGEVWVELTHDVLVPVVSASRGTRQASEAQRRAEEQRHALEQRLRESHRRQAIVVVALCLMAVSLGFAIWKTVEARRGARTLATFLTDNALKRARMVPGAALLPQLAHLLRSQPDDKVPGALLASLLANRDWPLLQNADSQHPAGFIKVACSSVRNVCATGSEDGVVDIRNPQTGKRIREVARLKPDQTWVEFSGDGQRLLIWTGRGHLELVDTGSWERVGEPLDLDTGLAETAPAISDRGDYVLYSGKSPGRVMLWRPGQKPQAIGPHSGQEPAIIGYANGNLAVSVFEEGGSSVSLWEIGATGAPQQRRWVDRVRPNDPKERPSGVSVSRDGRVAATFSKRLVLWDNSGKRKPVLDVIEEAPIVKAVLTPDGRWLAWATEKHIVRMRSTSEPAETRALPLEETVRGLGFSSDSSTLLADNWSGSAAIWDVGGDSRGRIPGEALTSYYVLGKESVVSASLDGLFQVWDTRPSAAAQEIQAESQLSATSARFVDDHTVVGVWRGEGSGNTPVVVKRWHLGRREAEDVFPGCFSRIAPAISPDGRKLVTVRESPSNGTYTYTLELHSLGTADVILPAQQEQVNAVAFSPDGRYFAVAFQNGRIELWNAANPKQPEEIPDRAQADRVSLSDGGRRVASSDEKAPHVFDTTSRREVGGLSEDQHELVKDVSLSADGSHLATVAGNIVRVWSLENDGAVRKRLLRDDISVKTASFGYSNRWIVTTRRDNTVRLWDIQSERALGLPLSTLADVLDASVSPDGRHVVAASADGKIRVWDIVVPDANDAETLANLAEAIAGARWEATEARVKPLTGKEVSDRLEQLRSSTRAGGDRTDSQRLVHWFLQDRSHRPISPLSSPVPDVEHEGGTRAPETRD